MATEYTVIKAIGIYSSYSPGLAIDLTSLNQHLVIFLAELN